MKQVLKEKCHKQEKVNPFLSEKLTSVVMLSNAINYGDNLYPGSEDFHTIILEGVKEPDSVVHGSQESHLPASVHL